MIRVAQGDPDGICKYQVKINSHLVCEYYHDRNDGLAVCLEKAARAVREQEKGEGDGAKSR